MDLNLKFDNITLNPKTTRFVVASNVIVLLWSVVCAITSAGWVWISVLAYGFFAAFVIYAWREKDTVLAKLMVFGFVTGLLELYSDHHFIQAGSLVYPTDEPML